MRKQTFPQAQPPVMGAKGVSRVMGWAPAAEVVLQDSMPYDQELKASGHFVAAEALQGVDQAMTVQVRDGKMSAVDGPFIETKEMLAASSWVEARDLNEALRLAAGIPLAKLGSVEVRPVVDFSKPRPKL